MYCYKFTHNHFDFSKIHKISYGALKKKIRFTPLIKNQTQFNLNKAIKETFIFKILFGQCHFYTYNTEMCYKSYDEIFES